MRMKILFISLLASAATMAADVPRNVVDELKRQLATNRFVYITVALDVPFEPNVERLTSLQLEEQTNEMQSRVKGFVRRLSKTKHFRKSDFTTIPGSMAPLVTVRVTRKNFNKIQWDREVLYFAPLTRESMPKN